jgi:hypothetical protein
MSTLSEAIRGSTPPANVAVPTPEWPEADGKLFAERATMKRLGTMYEAIRDDKQLADVPFSVAAVISLAVDAEGHRVFSAADAAWLAGESCAAPVRRLWGVIDEVNAISDQSREILRKNSETTPA